MLARSQHYQILFPFFSCGNRSYFQLPHRKFFSHQGTVDAFSRKKERAERESQRAERESQRAEQESQRAEQVEREKNALANKQRKSVTRLLAMGLTIEQVAEARLIISRAS